MAITNYAELKAEVASWIHRTDLETKIPDFIYLAEKKISNNIRSRQLEVSTNIATVAGEKEVELPADFTSAKSIQISGTINTILSQVPVNRLLQYNAYNETGTPQFYSIQNNSLILSPIPDDIYSINLVYYQDLVPLSGTTLTNWVLDDYPYIYLYGALIEASIFTNDPELMNFYQQKFNEAISDMWANNSFASFSGSPLYAVSDYIM